MINELTFLSFKNILAPILAITMKTNCVPSFSQQVTLLIMQLRRRPKRARSTLPRAPPSPLPSPAVAAQDNITNEEETAAAAIATLGECLH